MLDGIHIVDFGNHRDTELRFGTFTAPVVQNGAGKTNLIRAREAIGAGGNHTTTWKRKRKVSFSVMLRQRAEILVALELFWGTC